MIATDLAPSHCVSASAATGAICDVIGCSVNPRPGGRVGRGQADGHDAGGEVERQRLRADTGVVRADDTVEARGDRRVRGLHPGSRVGGVVDRHDLDLPAEHVRRAR